jgi:hypothetical protein
MVPPRSTRRIPDVIASAEAVMWLANHERGEQACLDCVCHIDLEGFPAHDLTKEL